MSSDLPTGAIIDGLIAETNTAGKPLWNARQIQSLKDRMTLHEKHIRMVF